MELICLVRGGFICVLMVGFSGWLSLFTFYCVAVRRMC